MPASSTLPPVPIGAPSDSYVWQDYQVKLQRYLTSSTVLWANVDKTGSNLTDLATRLHSSLQGIQGGSVGQYNHLTNAQVTALTGAAPLASPTFTGTPAAPTAAVDTNTTQLATTAYVVGQAGATTPIMDGVGAVGTSLRYSRQDHVHPTDTTRAPIDSPAFTTSVGFNGSVAIIKPTITGSRGGNAALADLLTQLALYGLITDGTTA